MKVFWKETRRGQRLVLGDEAGGYEEEIGGVRETKRGFDAFAKTFGYEPGRAHIRLALRIVPATLLGRHDPVPHR